MNVLSLFDGMSCGQIALNRLGIGINNYYASEIDKYAIEITQKNYPDTIQLGDVTKWEEWDIDWSSIDLVSGGFPCQAWSVAGNQQGDRDPRGMLFWTLLDVIKKVRDNNPDAYFLMENVKMKKEFEEYITFHTEAALGRVEKHLINSSLVSAQSRQRYYWTNIPNIVQPEDKGIVLRDILEDGFVDRDKSHCVDANYFKGGNLKSYFEKNRRQLVFDVPNPELMRETPNYWQFDTSGKGYASQQDRIRKLDVPSNTLSAGSASIPKIMVGDYVLISEESGKKYAPDGGKYVDPYNKKNIDGDKSTTLRLNSSNGNMWIRVDDDGNKTLCVNEATKKGYTEIQDGDCFDATFPNSKTRRGRNMKDKSNCLTATNYDYMRYEHPRYRKLTPVECERLQTVPDGYTEGVSNSQRYKMLGNGWTVDVIKHIYKFMEWN